MNATQKAQMHRMLKEGMSHKQIAHHLECGESQVWYAAQMIAQQAMGRIIDSMDARQEYLDDCDLFGVEPMDDEVWRANDRPDGLLDDNGQRLTKLYCDYLTNAVGTPLSLRDWYREDCPTE